MPNPTNDNEAPPCPADVMVICISADLSRFTDVLIDIDVAQKEGLEIVFVDLQPLTRFVTQVFVVTLAPIMIDLVWSRSKKARTITTNFLYRDVQTLKSVKKN